MTKALKGFAFSISPLSRVRLHAIAAWFGADVIKVERPGVGDITRGQLQDIPMWTACISPCSPQQALDHARHKNPKGKEV